MPSASSSPTRPRWSISAGRFTLLLALAAVPAGCGSPPPPASPPPAADKPLRLAVLEPRIRVARAVVLRELRTNAQIPAPLKGDVLFNRLMTRWAAEAIADPQGGSARDAFCGGWLALADLVDEGGTLRRNPLFAPAFRATPDERVPLGGPSILGRTDWVAHFLIAGALAIGLGESAARDFGIQKELSDAAARERGEGSGFDFGDLTANEAGIHLVSGAAASSAAAADWLKDAAAGFDAASWMPEAGDFPAGLTRAEFRNRFGSTRDPRFADMLKQIRDRVELAGWRR